MTNNNKVLKVGSNEMELVDFRIFKTNESGDVEEGIYGINVAKVREIIKRPRLTELPTSQDFIDGMFDLRGVPIPVVNLAKWFGIDQSDIPNNSERIIITEFNNILIGFTVDDTKRIRRINWKDIEAPSFNTLGGAQKNMITGITRLEDNNILLIIDFESIVQELGLYTPSATIDMSDLPKFNGIALALDDSITARKIVKTNLEKLGLRVVEAKNGEEGLKRLEELYEEFKDDIEDAIKVIISDVEMPGMDGFHFASKFKNDIRFKKLPIIFHSSISDSFSTMRAEDVNADGYLVKFDEAVFIPKVIEVINKYNN